MSDMWHRVKALSDKGGIFFLFSTERTKREKYLIYLVHFECLKIDEATKV